MQVVFNCDSVERLRMLLEMAPIEDATILWLTKHGRGDTILNALPNPSPPAMLTFVQTRREESIETRHAGNTPEIVARWRHYYEMSKDGLNRNDCELWDWLARHRNLV